MLKKPSYEELEKRLKELEEETLEYKIARDALQDSEEKYKNLVELSPDPIIIIQDDRYRFINSAFTRLLGYTQEDVDNGLSFYNVVQDHDKETASRRYQDRISEKPVGKKFSIDLISKEGRIIAFESSGIMINYDGRPAFMSIVRDMTEQKQAEESLRKAHDELEKRVNERTVALTKLNEQLNREIDERKNMEEALSESEKKYRLLFENAGALIHVFDNNGICQMLNGTAAFYYEGTPDDFVGKSFHALQFEEADKYFERIQNIVNSGEGEVYDELIRLPSGKKRWVLSNAQPIRDARGTIFAVQIISQDITEQRHAEEALKYSEKRYRLLAENVRDVIWTLDMNMKPTYLSPSVEKLRGYSADEAMNHTWEDIFTDDSLRVAKSTFEKAVEEANVGDQKGFKKSYVLELEMKCKDGSTVWTEIHASFIRNSDGRPSGVIGITRNISERKRAEELLRENEEKYRLITETAIEGIYQVDYAGKFVFTNEAYAQMLGYELGEMLGKHYSVVIPDLHLSEAAEIVATVLSGTPQKGEITMKHKLGKEFPVYFSLVPTKRRGKIVGFSGILEDITDLKQTENLIRDLSHQLIKSQENERQMISRELHDSVAQDLSSSRINCEMLLKYKSLTPGVKKQISGISENLQKILRSVRDLSYELRPPGLARLGLVQTMYQFCKDFSDKIGVRVEFQSAGIDNLDLDYDTKINLYRLLQESLNNVKKHADASNIKISLISSFPNIILRINDDGKGFDFKERLAKTYSEKRMGLRSMEERVGLLQGKINIESSPGKGTMVVIEIPYEDQNTGAGEDYIDH